MNMITPTVRHTHGKHGLPPNLLALSDGDFVLMICDRCQVDATTLPALRKIFEPNQYRCKLALASHRIDGDAVRQPTLP